MNFSDNIWKQSSGTDQSKIHHILDCLENWFTMRISHKYDMRFFFLRFNNFDVIHSQWHFVKCRQNLPDFQRQHRGGKAKEERSGIQEEEPGYFNKINANVTNAIPKLIYIASFIQIQQWESVQIEGKMEMERLTETDVEIPRFSQKKGMFETSYTFSK